ncbi:ATP-binding protein [Haloglycomyces albus]|uniref:ATP-binding protein n=1 Tax=Haloglycomyces albus TaxID=526067 RepID=UPI0004B81469|nr:ATP-binding protein [Haloglycomyces albus]
MTGTTVLRRELHDIILEACPLDGGKAAPHNLVFHGPTGSGKTTFLQQANELFDLLTNTGFVDCEERHPDDLPQILNDLRLSLTVTTSGVTPLKLPHLEIALAAYEENMEPDGNFEQEWPNILERLKKRRKDERRKRKGSRAPSPITLKLSFKLLSILNIDLERRLMPRGTVTPRFPAHVEEWFKRKSWGVMINSVPPKPTTTTPEVDRDDPQNVHHLHNWETRKRLARNEWLVRAFVEDLKHHRASSSEYRNIVFLDDVAVPSTHEASAGQEFIDLLHSAQASPRIDRDLPLLLVATGSRFVRRPLTKGIPMPDFTKDDLDRLSKVYNYPIDRFFPELIGELTGGYAAASAFLMSNHAISQQKPHNGLDALLRTELPTASPDGLPQTMEQDLCRQLIEHLLPPEVAVHPEAVAICSLAKDRDDVEYLIHTYELSHALDRLNDYSWLAWDADSGAAQSAHTLLMRLLLRRWNQEPDWNRCDRFMAFRRLAALAKTRYRRHNDHAQLRKWFYYSLGAGHIREVGHALRTVLDAPSGELEFIRLIDYATKVPQPPPDPGDDLTPLQRFELMAEALPGDDFRLVRILRVVAGKWIIEDPMESMYTRDIHQRVKRAYRDLATTCGDPALLEEEAEIHDQLALERPFNPLDAHLHA